MNDEVREEQTEEESGAYEQAGVDINAGEAFVEAIKPMLGYKGKKRVGRTDGFAALYHLQDDLFLATSTDGVGTKAKLCVHATKPKIIGIDAAAMVWNDILCTGCRKPLFMLDYLGTAKLRPKFAAQIVQGVSVGCDYNKATLVGGETAEMPFTYADEYIHEIAAFGVGSLKESEILDGHNIEPNDDLIALPSSGLHANGFSLVNQMIEDEKLPWFPPPEEWMRVIEDLEAMEDEEARTEKAKQIRETMGEIQDFADLLLRPTRFYFKQINKLYQTIGVNVKGIAHITGGGLIQNLPRMLPEDRNDLMFEINSYSWEIPEIFRTIQKMHGEITDDEMFKVFNMGVGMVVCVSPDATEEALAALSRDLDEEAWLLGNVAERPSEDTPQVNILR